MAVQGADVVAQDFEEALQIRQYSVLQYLHTMLVNGGMWLMVVGCGTGVFCAGDYTRGAAKNIFPIFSRRWSSRCWRWCWNWRSPGSGLRWS